MKKSVAIVDKQEGHGGHLNTYFGPATGIPVGFCVVSYHNKSVVTDYFAHFKGLSGSRDLPINQSENVDFTTGELIVITRITILSEGPKIRTATENYMAQLAKYPFLENEYYYLPDPMPEHLLFLFKDFVTKYNIGTIVPLIGGYTYGFGDPLLGPRYIR